LAALPRGADHKAVQRWHAQGEPPKMPAHAVVKVGGRRGGSWSIFGVFAVKRTQFCPVIRLAGTCCRSDWPVKKCGLTFDLDHSIKAGHGRICSQPWSRPSRWCRFLVYGSAVATRFRPDAYGAVTLADLAEALTARGVATPSGRGAWHPAMVSRVMDYAAV
jgi:hypothetical protein